MDGTRFDTITRTLTGTTSRRRALGGLLGGAVATLAGAALTRSDLAEAAKGGNGKGKANGKGKRNNKPKVSFCHRTKNGTYQFITVGGSKQKGHRKHGDVECLENPCEGIESCTVICTSDGECVTST